MIMTFMESICRTCGDSLRTWGRAKSVKAAHKEFKAEHKDCTG